MTVSVIKAFILPPGYAHDHDHLIVLDPDIRIQDAVRTLFQKFDQFTSIRQLALWYADTKTPFPVRKVRKSNTTEWEVPTFSNIRKLLAHPIYAGVYTYGRRPLITEFVDGKIVKKQGPILPPERAAVYRPNNHEQYISWEKYLANQEKIATTRPRTQMEQNQGAVRDGLALLAGILRCGHCGRKIYVAYKRTQALYFCDGGNPPSSKRCLVFGSYLIDKMVTEQLIEALAPLAIKASETAFIQHEEMRQQDLRQG